MIEEPIELPLGAVGVARVLAGVPDPGAHLEEPGRVGVAAGEVAHPGLDECRHHRQLRRQASPLRLGSHPHRELLLRGVVARIRGSDGAEIRLRSVATFLGIGLVIAALLALGRSFIRGIAAVSALVVGQVILIGSHLIGLVLVGLVLGAVLLLVLGVGFLFVFGVVFFGIVFVGVVFGVVRDIFGVGRLL